MVACTDGPVTFEISIGTSLLNIGNKHISFNGGGLKAGGLTNARPHLLYIRCIVVSIFHFSNNCNSVKERQESLLSY